MFSPTPSLQPGPKYPSQSFSLQPISRARVAKGLEKSGKALCSPARKQLCPSFWRCKAILALLAEESSAQPSDLLKHTALPCLHHPQHPQIPPPSLGRGSSHPTRTLGMVLWNITHRILEQCERFQAKSETDISQPGLGLSPRKDRQAMFSGRHNWGFVWCPQKLKQPQGAAVWGPLPIALSPTPEP